MTLIKRADAIEAIPDTMADMFENCRNCKLLDREQVIDILSALPSAEAVPQSEQYKKGFEDAKRAFELEYAREAESIRKRNAQLEVMLNVQRAISAEAEDRLYIKIYADDEPSVMAEKLYQICGETQNREVAKWLKEYFSSAEEDGEDYELATEQMEHDAMYEPTYNSEDVKSMPEQRVELVEEWGKENPEEPQADLIIVGDVVGTKWDDGDRGIVVAVANREQYKVVTTDGDFEDWINPVKFGANYEIYRVTDLIDALLDI